MTTLKHVLLAFREIGPGNVTRAALYQTLLRSGFLRLLTPSGSWSQYDLAAIVGAGVPVDAEAFGRVQQNRCALFQAEALRTPITGLLEPYKHDILEAADAIMQGTYPAFGMSCRAEVPPNWFAPLPIGEAGMGSEVPSGRHWTGYVIDEMPADVKLFWELSRFGWVYPLARAFQVSGDRVYLHHALDLIRDWQHHNPPNEGPHWISAQEVALRILALAFLIQVAGDRLEPQQWAILAALMAAHADRILATRLYARAQDNNHLLVEAAGLLTAGLLFPGLKHARRWETIGRRELELGYPRQVFPDGGYIQHSHTYARVALQAGSWAVFISRECGHPLSGRVEEALRRLARGLSQMLEVSSGDAPNYGPNDGAYIRPLSTTPYRDFRPSIQAASLLLDGEAMYPPGRWDEEAYWLGWRPAVDADNEGRLPALNVSLPAAGLHRVQGNNGWAVLRCGRFENRPGHSDQLHMDLWRGGLNILCDPGTYHYNASLPWENPFSGRDVHNTAWLAGEEPMLRGGRFLWLNWDQGDFLGRWVSQSGRLEAVCGAHGALAGGLRHRRTLVRLAEEGWVIVDDFLGAGSPDVELAWNLRGKTWQREGAVVRSADTHPDFSLHVDDGLARLTVYVAGEAQYGEPSRDVSSPYGWYSPTYAVKEPCVHVSYSLCRTLPFRLVTWVLFAEDIKSQAEFVWRSLEPGVSSLQSLVYAGEQLKLTDAYLAHSPSIRRTG